MSTLTDHERLAYEQAGAGDRAWFDGRPDRRYRFRPAEPSEAKLLAGRRPVTHVLVRKVHPDCRLRFPVLWTIPGPTPDDDASRPTGRRRRLYRPGRSSMNALSADRAEIDRFINAVFCHADLGGFVSLRSFEHERGKPPVEIRAQEINGEGLAPVIAKATGVANRAARHPRPTVFAPITSCTFANDKRAAEADVAQRRGAGGRARREAHGSCG